MLQIQRPRSFLNTPGPVTLSSFSTFRRQSERAREEREPGFEAAFDDDTLLFDAFHAGDGRRIRILCPPFLNLLPHIKSLRITADADPAPLVFRVRPFYRQSQIEVEAGESVRSLTIDGALGRISFPVGANHSNLFDDQRVLLTMSKDNPLAWIQDWVRYHRDIHGATAALVYDNGTTVYPREALLKALESVGGMQRVGVVDWPFKFGPQGLRNGQHWESFFCQCGMLQHARYRYLRGARSVLPGDIDELLLAQTGTLFEHVEKSPFGVASYHGVWIIGRDAAQDDTALADRRHRQFTFRLPTKPERRAVVMSVDANRCLSKYSVVPRRCPEWALWDVHRIRSWLPVLLTTSKLSFRHFRQINTSWKYDRTGAEFDLDALIPDEPLRQALERVRWHV